MGLRERLSDLADRVLDWTVVPGFSRIGYGLRENLVPRGPLELKGKTVMLTGANSGIGEAACGQLAQAGAQVLMVVRDPQKGERSRQRILASAPDAEAELDRRPNALIGLSYSTTSTVPFIVGWISQK